MDRTDYPTGRPQRRRPRDEDEEVLDVETPDEPLATIIPYKNAKALIAYYLGVFALIPGVGAALGPAAFILGILCLRYVQAHPSAKGTGHAITGIVLGALTTLGNWLFLLLLVAGAVVGATRTIK